LYIMAPQRHIPMLANVFGTFGTICWCIQIIPQIVKNFQRGSTEGVPGLMLFLWAICTAPFGAYAVVQNFNLPLQIQPSIFCALCLVAWAQTLVYENKFKIWFATFITIAVASAFAGLEVLLVFVIKGPYARGVEWPVTSVGIIAAILLTIGLLPLYWEMWKRQGRVLGLSFKTLGIDFAGALLSLVALTVQHTFDIVGGLSYLAVMLLEIGVVASHLVWYWRTRHARRAAKAAGLTYDQYVELDAAKDCADAAAVSAADQDLEAGDDGGRYLTTEWSRTSEWAVGLRRSLSRKGMKTERKQAEKPVYAATTERAESGIAKLTVPERTASRPRGRAMVKRGRMLTGEPWTGAWLGHNRFKRGEEGSRQSRFDESKSCKSLALNPSVHQDDI